MFIWMARKFGPLEYSYFVTALIFTKVAFGASELGLQPVVTRELASKTTRADEYIRNALVIRLIACILTSAIVQLAAFMIKYPPPVRTGITIFSFYMIFLHFSNLNLAVLRGKEKQNSMAVITLIGSLSIVLLASYFILNGYKIFSVQIAFVIGALIQLLFGFYYQKQIFYNFNVNYQFCIEILRKSIPFGLVAISSFIYFRVDEVMLSFFFPNSAYVGLYDAAYNIFYAIAFIPMVLYHIFLPAFSRLNRDSLMTLKQQYQLLQNIIFLYSIILCTVIYFFAEFFILSIYGDKYLPSVMVLKMLMIGGVFLSLSFIIIAALTAIDKGMVLLKIVGGCAILNTSMNFFAIPYFNIMGAAFTTILTEAFLVVLGSLFLNRYFKARLQPNQTL